MGYNIIRARDKNNKPLINIELVRGDTLKLTVGIKANGQTYTPVAGDSLRFALKTSFTSPKVLILKPIPIETCVLHLQPSDTKKLDFGKYVYDIEITFANGDVDTFIQGQFDIKPEVY